MSPGEIFQAAGGGLLGLVVLALLGMFWLYVRAQEARIKEAKEAAAASEANYQKRTEENAQLRQALNDLTEVVRSWTPDGQARTLRRRAQGS